MAAALTDPGGRRFHPGLRTLCEAAGSNLPFYAGAISQLNIMVWAAMAARLLTAYMLPTDRAWFSLFGAFVSCSPRMTRSPCTKAVRDA